MLADDYLVIFIDRNLAIVLVIKVTIFAHYASISIRKTDLLFTFNLFSNSRSNYN